MSRFWRAVLLFGKGMEEDEKDAALKHYISQLIPWFRNRGFTYRRAEQRFVRAEGDVIWKFGIGLSLYADRFDIRPMGCVRHDQVERIFHRISESPEQVQSGSATVLWSWAVEKRTPRPNVFMVERRAQAQSAVAFTEHFFRKWVEPFFREHSDLQSISDSFNGRGAILRAEHVIDWFDLLGRAIIAAKLAKRGDYDALKKQYRQALERRQSAHRLSSFDALIQVLEREA